MAVDVGSAKLGESTSRAHLAVADTVKRRYFENLAVAEAPVRILQHNQATRLYGSAPAAVLAPISDHRADAELATTTSRKRLMHRTKPTRLAQDTVVGAAKAGLELRRADAGGRAAGRGRRTLGSLVASVALVATSLACNQVAFLVPAPNPRGVTIPLPPPSFTAEPEQRFDIEGDLDSSLDEDGIRISLFEQTTGRGYFTYSVGGSWLVPDVLVDTTDNCMTLSSYDFEGNESIRQDFKLFQASDEACVEGCSQPDDLGVCVCFEKWNAGC